MLSLPRMSRTPIRSSSLSWKLCRIGSRSVAPRHSAVSIKANINHIFSHCLARIPILQEFQKRTLCSINSSSDQLMLQTLDWWFTTTPSNPPEAPLLHQDWKKEWGDTGAFPQ